MSQGSDKVKFTNVFGSENYCVGFEVSGNKYWGIKYYNFNGNSWNNIKYEKKKFATAPFNYYMYGTDHTVSRFRDVKGNNDAEIFRWTGFKWEQFGFEGYSDPGTYFFGNDDYWIRVHKSFLSSFGKIIKTFSWDYDPSLEKKYKFKEYLPVAPDGTFFLGNSWILAEKTFYITFQPGQKDPGGSSVVVWNGQQWNLNDFEKYDLYFPDDPKTVKSAASTANSFGIVDNENIARVYYKLGDRFAKNFYTYAVVSKKDNSAYARQKSYRYRYTKCGDPLTCDGIYDVENGTAKFNYVIEHLPNGAEVVRYFYNDTKADNQNLLNAGYKELDGNIYKMEYRDDSSDDYYLAYKNTQNVHRSTSWPKEVNTLRILKRNTVKDKVVTVELTDYEGEYGEHEDLNGRPVVKQINNSDGKVARYNQFAFEIYPQIKTQHILAPAAKQMYFKGNLGDEATVVESSPVSFNLSPSPHTHTFSLGASLQNVENGDKVIIDFKVKTNSTVPEEQVLVNRVKYELEIGTTASPPDDIYTHVCQDGAVLDNDFSLAKFDYIVDCLDGSEEIESVKLVISGYDLPVRIEDLKCTVIEGWQLTDNNILSAGVTAWKLWDFDSKQVWAPFESFVWKEPMDSDGNPENPYVDFQFDDPAASVSSGKWLYKGSISKYNQWGLILEQKVPYISYPDGVTRNAVFYRSDFSAPMASASGTYYDECGFFTCDYDQNIEHNSTYYFDFENGWIQGGKFTDGELEVSTTKPHFGQKSLRVKNSFGPTKKINKVDPTQNYIFSAWIYVVSGKPRFVVESHVDNSGIPSGPNYDDFVTGTTGWTLVKRVVTSSRLQAWGIDGTNDYLKIWIGNYNTDAADMAEFYIDDIRFYPENALVSTTYYDLFWQQPIVTIESNDNPSPRVVYDEHGRIDKMNYIKYKNDYSGFDTLVVEREYHLVGQTE